MSHPTAHKWQQAFCESAARPILNAASKEDPAKLGERYDAVNLDLVDFDIHTGTNLTRIRNFVQGSVTDIGVLFPVGHFPTVVLGEFIEHATVSYAQEVLGAIHAALPDGGVLALTFPLDDRPAHVQHGKEQLKILVGDESDPKFTSWHRTVWTDELLGILFGDRWEVLRKETIHYGFAPDGWGIVLRKLNVVQEQEQG